MKISSLLILSSYILIISLISIFNTINIVSEANEPDIFLDVVNEPDIFLDVNTTDKNISTEPIEIPTVPTEIIELIEFLEVDTTDQHIYLPWYTCGHFSRDLAHNASDQNISMGSVILGNHPVFRGYQNHIINYIEINDTLYFIEPQTDYIMELDTVFMEYQYIRLYSDGTQVPTYWRNNMAPDLSAK